MKEKHTVNIHPSKIQEIIYPRFSYEFWESEDYEEFAEIVQGHFYLTPEQWEALLNFYELIHQDF